MAFFIRDEIKTDVGSQAVAGRDAIKHQWETFMVDDGKKVKSYDQLNTLSSSSSWHLGRGRCLLQRQNVC